MPRRRAPRRRTPRAGQARRWPIGQHPLHPLDRFLAEELRREAPEVAERWLERFLARRGRRPHREFPRDVVRGHVRQLVEEIADATRAPAYRVTAELKARLARHARARRTQGFSLQDLLEEFEILDDLLAATLASILRRYAQPVDADEAVAITGRVHAALMSMGALAASLYYREEAERRRELARLMAEFGRTLAHEIKNPLSAAEGAAELLREEGIVAEPAQRSRFLDLLRRNLERIRRLVDDVHVLAESTETVAGVVRVPLREVIRRVVETVADEAEERNVRVVVEEPIPDIEVDGVRLYLALVNLARNAIVYSDPAKPDRWVRIGVRGPPVEPALYVADNGIGIAPEAQRRIFEPYVRAGPGARRGAGLGLAIARQAMDQLGGRIWLESTPDVGATFYLSFPGLEAVGAG